MLIFLCFVLLFPTEPANANVEKKTIMVFAPHQDDEANMANAVMYSHAKRGDDVYVVMGFGSDPNGTSNDLYGLNRLIESRKNLEKLGIPGENLIYLGYQKIDYAAQAYGDNTLKLGSEDEMLRTDGTSYYTYSHKDEGFPSFHSTINGGAECKASEANLISDIINVIKKYKPDELYVINYDGHLEHMWLGSVVDQAFGKLKQQAEFKDYCPRYYQSMSYQSAWQASKDFLTTKSPNDGTRLFLESTLSFTPRNTTFTWADRIRFPVEDEMSMSDLEKNLSAQAYIYGFDKRVYNPNGDKYMLGCINGDQVFWERDTRNLAYQADVSVTSNMGDGGKINDFSTMRMPLTSFLKFTSLGPAINCSQYKWSPDSSDAAKTVTLTFEQPQNISSVKLYDDYRTENQIKAGVLTFSDGSTVDVGELKNNGSATTVTFSQKTGITSVSFKITSYNGTPGLAEFEVYEPNSPRKTDYIQIYLDKVNGSDWKNKSFLYDYPVDVTSKTQIMQLGVYCYPNEAAPSGYNWGLNGGAQGITLTQNGLLTVTPEAESGSYQIQVTSKDDANLTDVMTIQIKGKKSNAWDINMDGHCDYRDLAYVLMGLDGLYQDCADVNGDGVINTKDVSLVWEHIKLENQ